jgi:hypothetical protein
MLRLRERSAFGSLPDGVRVFACISDLATLAAVTTAHAKERNAVHATVHWRFTTVDVRTNPDRLYSTPQTS